MSGRAQGAEGESPETWGKQTNMKEEKAGGGIGYQPSVVCKPTGDPRILNRGACWLGTCPVTSFCKMLPSAAPLS